MPEESEILNTAQRAVNHALHASRMDHERSDETMDRLINSGKMFTDLRKDTTDPDSFIVDRIKGGLFRGNSWSDVLEKIAVFYKFESIDALMEYLINRRERKANAESLTLSEWQQAHPKQILLSQDRPPAGIYFLPNPGSRK